MNPAGDAPPGSETVGGQARTRTARFAGLMAAGLALSRGLGLVRDILLAYFLGTGHVAEAWMVAFRIPNVLRMLLSEGSLNSAFVPVLSEYLERHPRAEVKRLVASAAGATTLFALGIAVIGFVTAPYIARLVAPGFADEPGKLALTAHLMRWAFVYLFLVAVATLFMGVLQSLSDFRTSAVSPALFNVALILAILFICPLFGSARVDWINGLLVGAILAGVLQLVIQLPLLKRRGLLPAPTLHIRHPGVQRMGRLMLPTFIGIGVAEIAIVVNTLLATLLGDGAVAAIEYATRVAQVPYMVCAAALSTAMLPLLSRQQARGELRELAMTVSSSLRGVVFLMAPFAVLIAFLAEPAVRLLFERGAFGVESTARTAFALRYFAPLLLGASVLRVMTAAFFSMQDTRTPVKVAVVSLVFNAVAGIGLMQVLDVGGLALAISLTPCLGGALLIAILGHRLRGLPWAGWPRTLLVTAIGCGTVIGVVTVVDRLLLGPVLPGDGPVVRLAAVAVPAVAGLLAYGLVGRLGNAAELAFLVRAFRRPRGRRDRG